jgi:deoxycytidylate deaminase
MPTLIPDLEFPELFFGFVSPIGVDLRPTVDAFKSYLEGEKYHVHEIRVTDLFKILQPIVEPSKPLSTATERERYQSYIAYGNQLREHFDDDAVLAALSILRVMRARKRTAGKGQEPFSKVAYLLHQFKRKEEIDLLRSVYGRLFFQVSVYSRRGARVEHLARKFAKSADSADTNKFRSDAEALVQRDENEVNTTLGQTHGQQVAKIFHDADFIINADYSTKHVGEQIDRFCEAIFSSNRISPTKYEYGMFMAKAAALRTTDLSRQVGAAIFSKRGEIVCLGSNEVPKGTGGTYWGDDNFDDREFRRGYDSNDKRKRELLRDLINAIDPALDKDTILARKEIEDSQFMDALEYGRIVHAEMSAIADAARLGRSLRNKILFCTTFPCHMCAKHIVASGIERVVFLEPYPKSLAADLHSDSIEIESSDRGQYATFPAVKFEHFYGITPRRYRELFERNKRKDKEGQFQPYKQGKKRPFLNIKSPFYVTFEEDIISKTYEDFRSSIESEDN